MQRWEIKDPIHGYIELSPTERAIIDTPYFQRLRRIKQLSAAHLTYPGAEHTRFQHSLGVMHLAGEIAQQLLDVELINKDEYKDIRVAGLLHDIGHGPFSHIFESLLDLKGMDHEHMTTRIVNETEIKEILSNGGFGPSMIGDLSVGNLDHPKPYMNNVIAGQFCADVFDYLPRDSHFSGVEYGKVDIDRLVRSINVVDNQLAVKDTALYVLEEMVIARYMMFKAVYFHRSVRSAEVMLIRAMELAEEELCLTDFKTIDEYNQLDDYTILQKLLNLKDSKNQASKTAYLLTEGFHNRNLLKCAYETVVHRKDRFTSNILHTPKVRDSFRDEIAEEAEVDPNTVIVDVSTAPTVPYAASQHQPQDIPLYHEDREGVKSKASFSNLSPLGGSLVGYLDILRLYTVGEDLDSVRNAAISRLGADQ